MKTMKTTKTMKTALAIPPLHLLRHTTALVIRQTKKSTKTIAVIWMRMIV
jgi:hypothetical protein